MGLRPTDDDENRPVTPSNLSRAVSVNERHRIPIYGDFNRSGSFSNSRQTNYKSKTGCTCAPQKVSHHRSNFIFCPATT